MTFHDEGDKRACRVLLLPGWMGSGPDHWQTMWEQRHGDVRVQQDDWQWPKRGDWMAQLEEAVLADAQPVLLVGHSLGCHLASAWAGHSQLTPRVRGALLVAPPDLDRDDLPPQLAPWRSPIRRPLPFPTTLVYSTDDPYASAERSAAMAGAWGAMPHCIGPCGHVNGESGLGHWPEGRTLLERLQHGPRAGDQ